MNGDGATLDTPVTTDYYRSVRRDAEEFVRGLIDQGVVPEEAFADAVDECLQRYDIPSRQ